MVNVFEKEEEKMRGRRECCGVCVLFDVLIWSWVGGEKLWFLFFGWFYVGWVCGGVRWKSVCNVL